MTATFTDRILNLYAEGTQHPPSAIADDLRGLARIGLLANDSYTNIDRVAPLDSLFRIIGALSEELSEVLEVQETRQEATCRDQAEKPAGTPQVSDGPSGGATADFTSLHIEALKLAELARTLAAIVEGEGILFHLAEDVYRRARRLCDALEPAAYEGAA